MKTIVIAVLFCAFSVAGAAQSDSGAAKSASKALKEQLANRRNNPDNISNKKIIKDSKQQRAAVSKTRCSKKKKNCRQGKKADKRAAKDVLKDRNTRDPRLERPVKPVEKANPSVLKDSLNH
ncbi:hypothetical protein A8C56_10030 [Niabella ginsenosidivorans]|uniref:Uncharacterized protein n=1 Tax=Niabella ginsenosidivorans TaxID=1176587 RepID=A0A1A9I2I8_9BACT|nr:hypothetical protein [Niabella ginsenosidivorans]ANH81279.1 hypothetical protein A8C56_10030 [Niabella ginsenosidivorans]